MTSFIFTGPNILAGAGGGGGGQGGGGLDFFVPLLLMGVIFYFLLIRPQRKRQKALEAQIAPTATQSDIPAMMQAALDYVSVNETGRTDASTNDMTTMPA